MTPEQIRAWILLSIPSEGGDLTAIMWSADGINKAVPERAELSASLGWLKAAGLVEAGDPGHFSRSKAGDEIMAACHLDAAHIFEVWDKLTERLARIDLADWPAEPVSEAAFEAAYAQYHKEFSETYRALEKEDD